MERAEKLEEEMSKVYNLVEHKDRERYFRGKLPEIAPLAAEVLMAGSMEKNFIHNLAKFPTTRHESHWALQTFLLMELLQEIKALREELGGQRPVLKRRTKEE